jgi:hypothetical protein
VVDAVCEVVENGMTSGCMRSGEGKGKRIVGATGSEGLFLSARVAVLLRPPVADIAQA